MFGVLSLRKLFRIYYYSTTYDFGHFDLKDNGTNDTASMELLLLYVFTSDQLTILTGGADKERLEKTRAIRSFEAAQNFLNVCLDPRTVRNCGKCGKCMRTLLCLDMLDSLDSFQKVFDIEAYRKSRLDVFVYLIKKRDSMYLVDVYRYFVDKEPDLIQKAKEIFLSRRSIRDPALADSDRL